jgi:hypothetical protein
VVRPFDERDTWQHVSGKHACVSGKQCFGKTQIISGEYEMLSFARSISRNERVQTFDERDPWQHVSGKQCFGKTRIVSVEYEMLSHA